MRRDFLSLIGRPADLLKALRKIAVGGLIATTGASAAPSPVDAAQPSQAVPANTLTPTIVDRARKGAKLVLQLPGMTMASLSAAHRSHQSHSSHRSHVSSSGGGAPAPRPAPAPARPVTPAPTRPAPGSTTALDLTDPTAANAVRGEVVAIDTDARTITIRESATVRTTFAYRDDSKFETTVGVTVRLDDFADANSGRLPVATRDKVQITWRTSPDGKSRIVNTVKKTP